MGMETSGMERMESEMAHPCNLGYQVAVQGLKSKSNAVPMKKNPNTYIQLILEPMFERRCPCRLRQIVLVSRLTAMIESR